MKILVLGGNGFIGSHLVDRLLAFGFRVRVFDRVNNHYQKQQQDVDYHIGNFLDTADLAEALQGIDIVFHLISTSVPSTSNLDPIADINGNLVGTVQLLQLMARLQVPKIVYLSSGGTVYGNPEVEPVSEQHPLRPLCSYGVIKVAIENYLSMFHVLHGIQPVVLRASNPFGPRQGHIGVQGVIPTFLKQFAEGEPIRIWGDGSVVRDYIYIDDLTDLCLCAATSNETGVFNAGSGSGLSLVQLLQVLIDTTGISPNVEYLPCRSFDVKKIVLDINKTKKTFEWEPRVSLIEGIKHHWEWLLDITKSFNNPVE